jgi:hypothetical protein
MSTQEQMNQPGSPDISRLEFFATQYLVTYICMV